MRRTISTLMFLAVGGLALAAHAQDSASGNNSYYAAGTSTYRISDDDDEQPASATQAAATQPAATRHTTGVANAVGQPYQAGQEKNALYVSDKSGLSGQLLQTNYFDATSPSCGAGNACGASGGCNSCNDSCLSDCCNCDCAINTFRFEYLMWFSRGRNTPALVTTSPGGTALVDAGVLGLPDTTVLYGDDPIGTDIRNGGRLTFSHLFNDGITYGDVRFWGVEDSSETFTAGTAAPAIIGIPFIDRTAGLNQENAFLVGFPGFSQPGQIRVLSKNDLIGADAGLRRNWYDDGCLSIDITGGYQFTRLDDSIVISATTTAGPLRVSPPPGTTISIFDSFRTQNEFHAGSLGFLARSYRGNITLEGLFKVGLGNMRQRVIIDGATTVNGTSVTPGGIFAQPTNIGSFERNRFAFSPELNLNAVYHVNESWNVMLGYSFIYWSDVVLAGNQIDRNVNTSQFFGGGLTGVALPGVKFQATDFWVQGLSTGAEFRW